MNETATLGQGERIRFLPISDALATFDPRRVLVVTDPRLAGLLASELKAFHTLVAPEGEAAKCWESLGQLFEGFRSAGADRSWTVLSIGGGSVSDLAGLAAHLWMRGLAFSCVPSTLLAMVDASLGGKNAIDFHGYKNVIGSFQRPKEIFCDVSLLRSLDRRQFLSGLAEAVKHGIIDGEGYFRQLEDLLSEGGGLRAFDPAALSSGSLERLVSGSQRIKLGIVDADPTEKGARRVLNLGHSFGHPIELELGIPHGYAVSLGLVLALRFTEAKGMAGGETLGRVETLLEGFGLPTELGFLGDPRVRGRISTSLGMDKKREGGTMHFVAPLAIGRVEVLPISVAELSSFLEERFG